MSDKTIYSRRNLAIDMLRALTMFTMIFVNDFWKVHDVPHWLEHATFGEDFMGLADIVFPGFLFAVGMSIPYAIEGRYSKGYSAESTLGHILSRTFALLVMGAFITNSEYIRPFPEASGGRPSFPAGAKALPGNHNKGALRSFRYRKTHLLPALQLCGGCNGICGFPYH